MKNLFRGINFVRRYLGEDAGAEDPYPDPMDASDAEYYTKLDGLTFNRAVIRGEIPMVVMGDGSQRYRKSDLDSYMSNIHVLDRFDTMPDYLKEEEVEQSNNGITPREPEPSAQTSTPKPISKIKQEAIAVLMSLGYKKPEATDLVQRVIDAGSKAATSEELVHDCFRKK